VSWSGAALERAISVSRELSFAAQRSFALRLDRYYEHESVNVHDLTPEKKIQWHSFKTVRRRSE
jgi:hypothetical protein